MRASRHAAAALAAAVILAGVTGTPAAADTVDTIAVEFAEPTGTFRGGATGTLYGFGDDGVPTQALINGARITNTSQMPPGGAQHPSGDALRIEGGFFDKHGQDLYIYMQDYYPEWPYNNGTRVGDERTYVPGTNEWTAGANGVWDYLEVVEYVATRIATQAEYPERFVFKPFNEPDHIWYSDWSAMRDQFLADWHAVYDKIQEVYAAHDLPAARIASPGDASWQAQRTRDFLTYAQTNDVVPDVFIWHELGIDNLGTFRGNLAQYRAIESELGIDPLEVNITEYGMLRDMAVPGQLIQWFSIFEDAKVDAQTAYWNYAGNFSDNSARPNGANGGWWMFKWYGDLAGSQTVRVRPPVVNVPDTLQGIGAVDTAAARATVLYGGSSADAVRVDLRDLAPAVFGSHVDIEVREIQLNGAEGLTHTPRVVHVEQAVELASSLQVDVPNNDRYSGYQLIVTPTRDGQGAGEQPWQTFVEAEDTVLTDAQVYNQPPTANGGWKFLASGGRDVGSFNRGSSRAEWTVEVPRDGLYRFQVIGGTPGVPGRHALYVDDEFATVVQYTANLAHSDTSRWQYRGSAEVLVELTEGQQVLSLRGSRGGTTLPNIDITLDKFVLTDVTDGEPITYPASQLRLEGTARPVYDVPWARGMVELDAGGRVDAYLSAMDGGYYDVEVGYRSDSATSIEVTVNGRHVTTLRADGAGAWDSTARLHLSEGINEVELRSAEGAYLEGVTTTRVREADSAAVRVEAEDASLAGGAEVVTPAGSSGSNASGGQYVGSLGNSAASTLTISRQEGFDAPGQYDVVVAYANAEVSGGHSYNPQVVDRRLAISEGGDDVGDAHFRYTHAWNSFQVRTVAVELATGGEPLVLGNPDHWAPNVDYVVIAPAALGSPVTEARAPDPDPVLVSVVDADGEPIGPEDTVEPGTALTLTATGFPPLQAMALSVAGAAQPAVVSGVDGQVVVHITVPGDAPVGSLEVDLGGLTVRFTVLDTTEEPTTGVPTEEPTTGSPTEEPTTGSPTEEPTTGSPAEEPSAGVPAEEPTTGSPTEEPTSPVEAGAPGEELGRTGADIAAACVAALLVITAGITMVLRRRMA